MANSQIPTTKHYNLYKPTGQDTADIEVLNVNTDLIDDAIYQAKLRADRTINFNEIVGTPESMKASDVYSWAKQPNKPVYTAVEVGTLTNTEIYALFQSIQDEVETIQEEGIVGNLFPITEAQIDSLFDW